MNLKYQILEVLKYCGDYALMRGPLLKQVEVKAGGRIGDEAFDEALTALIDKGLVGTRMDDLTGDVRYLLTERGKTRAAEKKKPYAIPRDEAAAAKRQLQQAYDRVEHVRSRMSCTQLLVFEQELGRARREISAGILALRDADVTHRTPQGLEAG